MDTIVAIIATILFFLIIAGIVVFFIQRRKLKILEKKIESLVEVVDISKGKDVNIDLKSLKRKILTGSNNDLTKYAQLLYSANNSDEISGKFDKLVLLDKQVIEYGLIRISALEDNYDLSKYFPPLVVILITVLTAYNTFFQEVFFKDNNLLNFGFPLIIILGIYFYLTTQIGESRSKREAIIYLKSLLEYAREQQNNLQAIK